MYYDLNYLKGQTIAGTKQEQLGLAFLRFFFFTETSQAKNANRLFE